MPFMFIEVVVIPILRQIILSNFTSIFHTYLFILICAFCPNHSQIFELIANQFPTFAYDHRLLVLVEELEADVLAEIGFLLHLEQSYNNLISIDKLVIFREQMS
jgi:hypothetical protein